VTGVRHSSWTPPPLKHFPMATNEKCANRVPNPNPDPKPFSKLMSLSLAKFLFLLLSGGSQGKMHEGLESRDMTKSPCEKPPDRTRRDIWRMPGDLRLSRTVLITFCEIPYTQCDGWVGVRRDTPTMGPHSRSGRGEARDVNVRDRDETEMLTSRDRDVGFTSRDETFVALET